MDKKYLGPLLVGSFSSLVIIILISLWAMGFFEGDGNNENSSNVNSSNVNSSNVNSSNVNSSNVNSSSSIEGTVNHYGGCNQDSDCISTVTEDGVTSVVTCRDNFFNNNKRCLSEPAYRYVCGNHTDGNEYVYTEPQSDGEFGTCTRRE